jgi:hypothetical protein
LDHTRGSRYRRSGQHLTFTNSSKGSFFFMPTPGEPGWDWSATVGRLVLYESRLELARIMLADQDPEVAAIAAQPFQLTGPDQERVRRHVPDLLLVDRDGGVTVVDVKSH